VLKRAKYRCRASKDHWFHRCECGDMTLFDAQGRASHVDDRSHGQPAS
jgi:hypothetical protein